MKKSIIVIQLALLGIGAFFSLATSETGTRWIYDNPQWLIENLSQRQTNVSQSLEIRLRVGYRDFRKSTDEGTTSEVRKRANKGLKKIHLRNMDTIELVNLSFEIDEESTVITHPALAAQTLYLLDMDDMQDSMTDDRPNVDPIMFRTSSSPTVTGVWKNDDTLLITFSEPMNATDLKLGHQSIDIYWEEEGELHSIASSMNLANFVWDSEDNLFRVAPIESPNQVWVKVSGDVRAATGQYLDGNSNGINGEADDDFVYQVTLSELEICYTREDIPDTCISGDNLPIEDTSEDW